METTTSSPSSSRSRLGPLTAIFTPPSLCSDAFIICNHDCQPIPLAIQAQKCGISTASSWGLVDDPDCWPGRTLSLVNVPTPTPINGWGFYSPGVECPMGMTSACSSTYGVSAEPAAEKQQHTFQFHLVPSETAVGCCPSGYSCTAVKSASKQEQAATMIQSCVRYMTTSTPFPTAQCMSASRASQLPAVLPLVATYATTITDKGTAVTSLASSTISAMNLLAPMIQINWQATDRLETTTGGAGASTGAPNSSTADPGPNVLVDSSQGSGLSTAATAGIAVSVIVVGLGIIAFAACIFLRRRRQTQQMQREKVEEEERQRQQQQQLQLEQEQRDSGDPYYPGDEEPYGEGHQRYPSGGRSELQGSSVGDYPVSSPSAATAAFPSPESGHYMQQQSGGYFQPHGMASGYDPAKAELESPPLPQELPAQMAEVTRYRSELNG